MCLSSKQSSSSSHPEVFRQAQKPEAKFCRGQTAFHAPSKQNAITCQTFQFRFGFVTSACARDRTSVGSLWTCSAWNRCWPVPVLATPGMLSLVRSVDPCAICALASSSVEIRLDSAIAKIQHCACMTRNVVLRAGYISATSTRPSKNERPSIPDQTGATQSAAASVSSVGLAGDVPQVKSANVLALEAKRSNFATQP